MERRWRTWPLLLLALAMLAGGLGLRDPWPPDEPRYALVAREMAVTGQWLFPHRNGELYAEKPPVFLWLVAGAERLTGSERLGFLLPSLCASLLTLVLVVDLGRRLWNRRTGLLAGAALLCALQFVWQGRVAQIDAVLLLWTTLGLYGLLRHLALGPAWGWLHVAFLAMGIGVITKGVAFLPLLVLVPWTVLRRQRPQALPRAGGWPWATAGLLFAGAIAAWVVPMWLAVDASGDPALHAYRDNILFHQTATRYAQSWHHHRGPWYFLVQAPLLWLPLALVLPWAAPAWRRRLRRGDIATGLLLGWIALVWAFFTIPQGKRGVYILPALPAFALAVAPLLPGLLRRRDVRLTAFAVAVVLAAAPLAGCLAGLLPAVQRLVAREGIAVAPLLAPLALVGAAAAACCWWAGRRRGPLALFAAIATTWTLAGALVLPRLNDARHPAAFMARAQALAGPEADLAMLAYREQYVLAAPRGLTTFGYRTPLTEQADAARAWLAAAPGRRVLVTARAAEALGLDAGALVEVGRQRRDRWLLADSRGLIPVRSRDASGARDDPDE